MVNRDEFFIRPYINNLSHYIVLKCQFIQAINIILNK